MQVMWVGLVFLAMLAAGCGKSGSPPTDSPEANDDKHGDEVMASTMKGEARAWMKEPKHVFFKEDPKTVAKFVEEFYDAGAAQVLICDIEEGQGLQFAGGMLVVLPKEAATRAKLFEINGRAETAFQNNPVTDKGQKYLYYEFD